MGSGQFDYSVYPGPDLSRFRLSLVRLVTRSAKARFGQVGNQASKVKDQVGQGQGQELDNNVIFRHSMIIWVRSFLLQIILLGCSSYIFFGSMMTQICIQ